MFPMAYSPDLRKRILDFVEAGGKNLKLPVCLPLPRSTIDRWLAAENPLEIKKTEPKMRVIDKDRELVYNFPNLTDI